MLIEIIGKNVLNIELLSRPYNPGYSYYIYFLFLKSLFINLYTYSYVYY